MLAGFFVLLVAVHSGYTASKHLKVTSTLVKLETPETGEIPNFLWESIIAITDNILEYSFPVYFIC